MTKNLVEQEWLDQHTLRLRLNDPDTLNAMSEEMGGQFQEVVSKLKEKKELRVLILSGAGRAFSAGGNLDMLFQKTTLSEDDNKQLMKRFYAQFLSILDLDVPVIAALNGHAVGAGLCLALACDMRIVVKDAKLGLNFVRLGLHPGMGVTFFLPRLVGPARAAELLYCGKIITAEEGAAIGLVNKVVTSGEFEREVDAAASAVASAGPQSIRELKVSLRAFNTDNLDECLEREAACQALDYVGPEFLEGITAAKEKRHARF